MRVTSPPMNGNGSTDDVVGALSARLTEVLVENQSLKSQSIRKEVVHVQVPQYLDRPETVTEIANLKKQVESLNKYRLQIVPGTEKTKALHPSVITNTVDRIVYKTDIRLVYVEIVLCLVVAVLGFIAGRSLH